MIDKSPIELLLPEPQPNSELKSDATSVSPACTKPPVGGSMVYLMDCVEGMKEYPDKWFDLAIVDPPYGIGADKEKFTPINETWKGKKKVGYEDKEWDLSIPEMKYFTELIRVSKNQIVWGANYFGLVGGYLFWDKKETMPTYTKGELAWVSFINRVEKFDFLWSGYKKQVQEERIHPTQKPVYLYEYCFQLAKLEKGMRVLDTHLGSGSSRIAADKNGLDFVGFEIDKEYYNLSEKRFNNYKSQLRIEGW
jgi:site-specific DNA-methyltransferase (adenine-specific)